MVRTRTHHTTSTVTLHVLLQPQILVTGRPQEHFSQLFVAHKERNSRTETVLLFSPDKFLIHFHFQILWLKYSKVIILSQVCAVGFEDTGSTGQTNYLVEVLGNGREQGAFMGCETCLEWSFPTAQGCVSPFCQIERTIEFGWSTVQEFKATMVTLNKCLCFRQKSYLWTLLKNRGKLWTVLSNRIHLRSLCMRETLYNTHCLTSYSDTE